MITFNYELEVELLRVLREPKRVEEISLPSSPAPIVMGAPNPFYVEAIKRKAQQLASEGFVELLVEDTTNATGSRQIRRVTGAWKITDKGRAELKRAAEESDRAERERLKAY